MNVDQWRQNEAEARQESRLRQRSCSSCGAMIEGYDGIECEDALCRAFICADCQTKIDGKWLCPECAELDALEREGAFEELDPMGGKDDKRTDRIRCKKSTRIF